MIDSSYLDILRCPHCAAQGKGQLSASADTWLKCADCGAQYPIVDDIPVMLPDEGERYRGVAASELPQIDSHQRHQA